MRHVDSLLKMMSALTGDDRFEQIVNERKRGERKVRNMCEVLDRAERKGEKKGEKKGILDTLAKLVRKKIITVEVAAQEANMSVDRFKKMANIQ